MRVTGGVGAKFSRQLTGAPFAILNTYYTISCLLLNKDI